MSEDTGYQEYLRTADEIQAHNMKVRLAIKRNEDISPLLKEFEESGIMSRSTYETAMYAHHVAEPRYIIDKLDITEIMDEFLASDSLFIDEMKGELKERTRAIQRSMYHAHKQPEISGDTPYKKYCNQLDKLFDWSYNRGSSPNDNLYRFRDEVCQLCTYRNKVQLTVKFKGISLTDEERKRVYEEKNMGVVKDLIMKKLPLPEKIFQHYNDIKLDEFIDVREGKNIAANVFLDDILNVSRRQYSDYTSGITLNPQKRFILALALYAVPPIPIKIEKFMNLHSYSIRSPLNTLEQNGDLRDRDISVFLGAGLDIDTIALLIKNHSQSRQAGGVETKKRRNSKMGG